jgi:alpha-mannosidase
VLATHWETLPSDADNGREPTVAGATGTTTGTTGFRVRLLETDGRGVRCRLRCFRPVAAAQKINPNDEPPAELTVEGDRIDVSIGAHQWIEVEAWFAAT